MAYKMEAGPYNTMNAIYKLKVDWDAADKAGDEEKKNKAAEDAKPYYEQLRSSGYGVIADQLSAADYTKAKEILDAYSSFAETSANNVQKPSATLTDSQLSTKNSNEVNSKINDLWGTYKSDRDKYYTEYDKISDYANSDVTKSAEYKSAFENIMPSYNIAALQAGNNTAADRASSNGGNIDSFAAANAMRQQAAMTAKGQALAHQMGMEAYQARLQNAQSLLDGLRGYQKDSWTSMQDTIGLQQNEAQRNFENDQTAKLNFADVTGYVPTEWIDGYTNEFLNNDGTVKEIYLTEDFDNAGGFQDIINKALARGDTETAAQARVARAKKIFGDYAKYGQYDNGDYTVTPKYKTEARRQFDVKNDTALKLASDENALTEKEINNTYATNMENIASKERTNMAQLNANKQEETVNKETKEQLDEVIMGYLNSPYGDLGMNSMYREGWDTTDVSPVYMAREKLTDPNIVNGIVSALKGAGYDDNEIKNKMKGYYRQQAINILRAENKAVTEENIEKELEDMPMPIAL